MPQKFQRKPYTVEACQIEPGETSDAMPIHGLKKGEHSGGAINGAAVLDFPVIRPLFAGDWAIIDESGRKFAMTDEAFRAIYDQIAEPEPADEPCTNPCGPPNPAKREWTAAQQWNGEDSRQAMERFVSNRRITLPNGGPTMMYPGDWIVELPSGELRFATSAEFLDQYLPESSWKAVEPTKPLTFAEITRKIGDQLADDYCKWLDSQANAIMASLLPTCTPPFPSDK